MEYFLPMLAVLFIGLKLTGYITWSWWLVLLPLYGGLAVFLLLLTGAALIAFTPLVFSEFKRIRSGK